MWLVLLGPPGAGKGTQAQRLTTELCIPHISTGEMLREVKEEPTELGRQVTDFLAKGELVPDDLIIQLLGERLAKEDCCGGALLDGFPRTTGQAIALEQLLADIGASLDGVLSIEVPQDEVVQRMLKRAKVEGRDDDTPEVIRNRMSVYQRSTQPLIDFYRQRNQLYPIDGLGSPNEVFERIQDAIESIRKDRADAGK